MSAARQLYTDDPRHNERVLYAMPNDHDESRETTTLAPETDRAERDTEPPDPIEDAKAIESMRANPLLPPRAPRSLEDSYLDRAIRVVAQAGEDSRRDRDERRLQHAAVIEAIRRSDANQSRNYEMLRDEIKHLKDSDRDQDRRLREGDERFAQIENSIEELKNELVRLVNAASEDAARRIGLLESELKELRANVPARQATPSQTG